MAITRQGSGERSRRKDGAKDRVDAPRVQGEGRARVLVITSLVGQSVRMASWWRAKGRSSRSRSARRSIIVRATPKRDGSQKDLASSQLA